MEPDPVERFSDSPRSFQSKYHDDLKDLPYRMMKVVKEGFSWKSYSFKINTVVKPVWRIFLFQSETVKREDFSLLSWYALHSIKGLITVVQVYCSGGHRITYKFSTRFHYSITMISLNLTFHTFHHLRVMYSLTVFINTIEWTAAATSKQ